MIEKNQIYKCDVCGNITEVLHIGVGELVCCGQPMNLMEEKTREEGEEKHLPVVEELPSTPCREKTGVRIKVGETEHPMDKDHHIEWIEIITADNKRGKKFLRPGEKAEIEFYTKMEAIGARVYCNIHGLWKI